MAAPVPGAPRCSTCAGGNEMRARTRSGWLDGLAAVGLAVGAVLGLPGGAIAATTTAGVAVQVDTALLASGLQTLNSFAATSQALLAQGDVAGARAAYAEFDTGWEVIE